MDAVGQSFDDLIKRLKLNIKNAKHGDDENHSTLLQSVEALPKFLGSRLIIEVQFEDYGLKVDQGTPAEGYSKEKLRKLQPKILQWINNRPSLQRMAITMQQRKKMSSLPRAKQALSYAIATNVLKKGTIKRFGYKGSHWFSREITLGGNKWEDKLRKKIEKALGMDVIVQFKIIAEEFKK
jgi:hypothetical protein